MAKVVRYIEPIESISGNFGQKQDLMYPSQNNSAWNSPKNQRNAAKNYRPTYIGLKRVKSGRNYFMLRRRSTFNSTPAMLRNCALMGAANSIAVAAMMDLQFLTELQVLYAAYLANGGKYNMRQYVVSRIIPQLDTYTRVLTITENNRTITVGTNPFTGETSAIEIPEDKLIKFWTQLAPNGIYYFLEGKKGIAFTDVNVDKIFSNPRLNVLGFVTVEFIISGEPMHYYRYGLKWLASEPNGEYLSGNKYLVADQVLGLQTDSPE